MAGGRLADVAPTVLGYMGIEPPEQMTGRDLVAPLVEVEQLLERARSKADEGDWEATADLLRDALGDFENEAAVHCWLGVAERELGMEGIAYERFKRALALDPTDPYVLATAGNGVAAFDDPDAERALRTAALTAPGVALTRLMYGAYLAREGFLDQGLEELRAASALDPDDPQIAYELGVAYALGGRTDEAADAPRGRRAARPRTTAGCASCSAWFCSRRTGTRRPPVSSSPARA